jgi:malate synthase
MTTMTTDFSPLQVTEKIPEAFQGILTKEALQFLHFLESKFGEQRLALLQKRQEIQKEIDRGNLKEILSSLPLMEENFNVGPIPADLQDRRVEITGPVDRKMVINALNCGSKVFMADFEDATSPTWDNIINGQLNLYDAIRNQIDFTAENGKSYRLNEDHAVLKVRPRGWHLQEKHITLNGVPVSASLVDFGLYFFHNAKYLLSHGSGPYFYLAKLENHMEARLWNEVFIAAQDYLQIPQGSIKTTVLVETIFGALEMDAILFELKEHIVALNAGRWDYIFSMIKKFRNDPAFILPDRAQITMSVPFMKAYATKLVQVCHRRGAHAIGGMSAFIPSKDEEANALAKQKVRTDKENEAALGYDGTWVAHPFLVEVAQEVFSKKFEEGKVNQKDKNIENTGITDATLLDTSIPGATITEAGVRTNINVAILYIESWLSGVGAAALYNLMEDAATAEISRAQLWQWIRHQASTANGQKITREFYLMLKDEELVKIKAMLGEVKSQAKSLDHASELLDELVLSENFEEFLTLPAYQLL